MPVKRILVVDDNLANLKLASEMMECEGYLVDRAIDADAALAAIAAHAPDLILMDLALPGMDGLDLTRHLRSRPETCRIPVVALTAFAMKRDEERAMEAGCDAYIVKPIDTRKLPGMLAGLLGASIR
ncbi:MAG: two-component response regulator [Fibrobacteres bacterium]|nr:two-component response regulator [Fibrobacterota bacterium]